MKKIFTMIGAALMLGGLTAQAEEVEFMVEAYNYQDYVEQDSFKTELVRNEDGSFTIRDFLNSGNPVSFMLKESEWEGYYFIVMCGNIYKFEGDDYPYLMVDNFQVDDEGWPIDEEQYMVCRSYEPGGEEYTTIWYPYVDDAEDPTYSSYCSAIDPEDFGYEYFGEIIMSGTNDEGGYANWYYVSFLFNAPAESGVDAINNENAPVEFYNLNGMRVENPSGGIFVRKQGNSTKKVIIK